MNINRITMVIPLRRSHAKAVFSRRYFSNFVISFIEILSRWPLTPENITTTFGGISPDFLFGPES